MRILILSRTAWRKDNSFGNTYSNIFGHMDNVEIANIYLGDGIPDDDNKNVTSYYKISEKQIVNRFLHFNIGEKIGTSVCPNDGNEEKKDETYDAALKNVKKKRWNIFFVAREVIWRFGKVDYDKLDDYIESFDPDIIFLSFYYAAYVDRIAIRIKQHFDIPMVLEAAIDIYSMKQVSLDPFFWINRVYIRNMIRKTVALSEKLYVISEKMKRDYTNMLQIPCDVLYKAPDLSRKIRDYSLSKEGDLVFLFTGNVSYGRWCSLSSLGGVVKKSGIGKLVIYTATPLTKKMKASLSDCEVHPPVSSSKVFELQNDADVLVHVESFGLKDKLEVRYSISTKIMDYISAQRCILAIGPKDIASMEFLSENKLAICINAEKNIPETISNIKRQRTVIMDCVQSIQKYINNTKSAKQSSLKLEEELYGIIENYKTKSNVIR